MAMTKADLLEALKDVPDNYVFQVSVEKKSEYVEDRVTVEQQKLVVSFEYEKFYFVVKADL